MQKTIAFKTASASTCGCKQNCLRDIRPRSSPSRVVNEVLSVMSGLHNTWFHASFWAGQLLRYTGHALSLPPAAGLFKT